MTPLIFDLTIIGLLFLSVALGFMRGFCSEVFTIIAWVVAIVATIYFTPVSKDLGSMLTSKKWLANLLTPTIIFAVTLGVFSVITHYATRGIHMTSLGIIDRSLGFAFGLLRGVVVAGLCFLLYSYVFEPDERHDFVQEARTRPFLEASAKWMQAILPSDTKIVITSGEDDRLDQMLDADSKKTSETEEAFKKVQ